MAELTIDLTYGNALYQAATETNKRDIILDEGCQVLGILEQELDLFSLINNPVISAKDKKEILKNIFQGRICLELLNLLYVLVDKGRTRHFPKIINVYKDMLNHEEGCAYGTIYSVQPLKEDQLKKFEEKVSKLLQNKVKLENNIDPKLIGGVKILVDGRIIDASIRKRFDALGSKIING
ncbi:MAG: ATP synthase F1 subunit delta [Anaerovoracaceae bacterium]